MSNRKPSSARSKKKRVSPFRKYLPYIIGAAALLTVALLVTGVVFFIPRDNTSFSSECFSVRMAVSGFLKDIAAERYDRAFESLYCTDADGNPVDSSSALRQAWIERISDLKKEDNTYLLRYSDLSVRKQDGKMIVTVKLSVLRDGYADAFYNHGNVITVVYSDGWRISSVSDEIPSLQTEFERAVSGVFHTEPAGDDA